MDRLQKILFLCFLCIIVSMIKHYKCECLVLQNITIGGKPMISLSCCFIILFSKY